MITLFASIAGFISSLIPEILKFFKDKSDKVHELHILDQQIEHSKRSKTKELEEINTMRDIVEHVSLYSTFNGKLS